MYGAHAPIGLTSCRKKQNKNPTLLSRQNEKNIYNYSYIHMLRASLVAQTVKNVPAMQETWVQSLGWEDPLEKGMATHSSILA